MVILLFKEQQRRVGVVEVPNKVRAVAFCGAVVEPLGGRPRLALGRGISTSSGELSRSTCSLASLVFSLIRV